MAERKASEGKNPEREGPYTRLIAYGTLLLAVIGYLTLAYTVHWWPFSSPNPGPATTLGPTPPSSSPCTTDCTSPPPSSTPPPGPQKSYYLLDLNVVDPAPFEGSFNTGVVSLGGQQYSKSFYEDACNATPIIVGIPANMTRVSGVAGYTDNSPYRLGDASGNPFQVEMDESTDPPGPNAQWRRIWLGTLPTHGVTSFSVPIDPGMDALELVPVVHSCGTDIGWGNPIVR